MINKNWLLTKNYYYIDFNNARIKWFGCCSKLDFIKILFCVARRIASTKSARCCQFVRTAVVVCSIRYSLTPNESKITIIATKNCWICHHSPIRLLLSNNIETQASIWLKLKGLGVIRGAKKCEFSEILFCY